MNTQTEQYEPGMQWDAKDDSRTIVIRSEAPAFRGERMFLVQTLSTGRTRLLSLPVLLRKYRFAVGSTQ